jgi:hypothetical protein
MNGGTELGIARVYNQVWSHVHKQVQSRIRFAAEKTFQDQVCHAVRAQAYWNIRGRLVSEVLRGTGGRIGQHVRRPR